MPAIVTCPRALGRRPKAFTTPDMTVPAQQTVGFIQMCELSNGQCGSFFEPGGAWLTCGRRPFGTYDDVGCRRALTQIGRHPIWKTPAEHLQQRSAHAGRASRDGPGIQGTTSVSLDPAPSNNTPFDDLRSGTRSTRRAISVAKLCDPLARGMSTARSHEAFIRRRPKPSRIYMRCWPNVGFVIAFNPSAQVISARSAFDGKHPHPLC
jgi:hypothetical protein